MLTAASRVAARRDGLSGMVSVAAQTTELAFGADAHDGVVGPVLELAKGSP